MLSLIQMCRACESGYAAPVWPDGGALLDQPVKLVQAFNMIRSMAAFYERPKR